MSIYLSLIIGICLLLVQVIKFRFSPFISLLTSSIVIGLLSGLDGEIIINNIQQGMGSTLGYIAVIVGLGAMFGAILESTGGAKEITKYLLNKFGEKKSQWALLISGFFIAIPVFFDVAFILLLPVIYSIQKKSNKSLVYYALPLLAGLAVTHAFIPPTPGPVAVSQILGADLGYVMLFGLIVGIPSAILSGVIFTNFITSKIDFNSKVVFDTEELKVNTTPSIRSVLLIILLPLILIIFRSLLDTGILSITNETVYEFIKFIGHPFSALILAIIRAEKGWPINLINSETVSLVILSIPVSSRDLKIIRISGRSIISRTDLILGVVFTSNSSVSKTTLELKSILDVIKFVKITPDKIAEGIPTIKPNNIT